MRGEGRGEKGGKKRGEGGDEREGEGREEGRGGRGREERGGLSGNVAEDAFCLKSAPAIDIRLALYYLLSRSFYVDFPS